MVVGSTWPGPGLLVGLPGISSPSSKQCKQLQRQKRGFVGSFINKHFIQCLRRKQFYLWQHHLQCEWVNKSEGSLTQQQERLDEANLQVPGSIGDVPQCLLWGGRIFHHCNCWTLPGLDDAAATQRCHTGALLPQPCPGKTLDLCCQRLHDQTALSLKERRMFPLYNSKKSLLQLCFM